ncbi:pentapeptide repeat-containing protein [Halobellus ruber]|uniref:Pentapeptide repeat-containing protein n=1 Tax=Halobellus ruber TaxID=2761102 RepID=A0A7J9SKI3_9EURY|nr:pentapeptide repeat-containing protein [Halobellus ruber]MBB6645531.1 pentapeptide repeat-containing protein [Halobellus ruber]
MAGSGSAWCGYEWPADCERVEGTDEPIAQSCCVREPVADAGRCVWHADPEATDEKTVEALAEARVPDDIADRTSPAGELLDGAILRGRSLEDAVDFAGAILRGADLGDADLESADLTDAILYRADLTDAYLRSADLTDAYLRSADLTDASLPGADLTDAYLRSADLTDAYLRSADLTDASLPGADLTDADLRRADLTDADLRRADLTDADLWDADLTDADLRRADLTDADLRDADLTDADLWDADLTDADLWDADLTDADLSEADLTDADLFDAALTDADLSEADLTDADLREAVLNGVDARQADLSDVDARDAEFTDPPRTTIPLGRRHAAGGSRAGSLLPSVLPDPDPDLAVDPAAIDPGLLTSRDILTPADRRPEGANLEDAVLEHADLRGADFRDARLYQTDLTDTRINAETTFDSTTLYERRPDLDGWFANTTESTHEAGAWVHRRLERLHEDNALSEDARRFHVRKQEAERSHYARLTLAADTLASALGYGGRWCVLTASGALTRHGESVRRVVALSVGVILLSALLYPFVGGFASGAPGDGVETFRLTVGDLTGGDLAAGEVASTLARSLYFSVITFSTIGYGDLFPTGTGSRILVGLESLAGAVLIALLIFVLGRRTAR